jgi:hypothetical protein
MDPGLHRDDEGVGYVSMRPTRWFLVIGLLLSLSVAGCAADGGGSDTDKRGGFYGGITGGGTWR